MLEALLRLYWDEFVKWTIMEDCEWRLDILNNSLKELHSEFEVSNTLENDRISNKLKVFIFQLSTSARVEFLNCSCTTVLKV